MRVALLTTLRAAGLGLALGLGAPAFAAAPAPAAAPVLTREPVLVHFVEAEFPASERDSGRGAKVVLRLEIAADGSVRAAEVVESAGPAFDEAARAAALRFVFQPAEVDGVPSAIRILYAYEFRPAPPEPPPQGALVGKVQARGRGTPLAGVAVSVTVVGADAPFTATTDEGGAFRIDALPPGSATVELQGEGFAPVRAEEAIEAGTELEVAYQIQLAEPSGPAEGEGDDLEIVVTAPPLRREVVSTSIRAAEASKVPGTSGDVLRVVESMPGVARAAAGSGQVIVWGAAPQDTRVYVDGVPVPRLYHEGGLRSVMHPSLVDAVELTPGGYGAPWGRGLGGMVRVDAKTPRRDRFGGKVAADLLDASAFVAAPLGRRADFAAALRVSYLRAWATRALGDEVAAYVPLPGYGDGQVRVLVRPSSRDTVEIVGMAASDRFRRGVPNPDPALATLDRRSLDFQRVYLKWTRQTSERSTLTVTPYVGLTLSEQATAFGALETSLRARSWLVGARANHRTRVTEWLRIDAGVDLEVNFIQLARRGALALRRGRATSVFGQPPPDQLGADAWDVALVGAAPYVEAEFSLWHGALKILPGLRLDPYARSVSRRNPPSAAAPAVGLFAEDFTAEPRLSIVAAPTDRLRLRAAAGLYRQMPAPEDLSATFGNPALSTPRALHVIAGGSVSITDTLSLELTGFFTRARDLAMRSPSAAPLPAEALVPIGSGRAYGLQAQLRQDLFKGLFGWIAYTLMRSERRVGDGPWRLSDFDQTHILTAVLAYALPRGFDASLRLRYARGFPRTPVTGAYYDVGRDLYQPIFGAQNSVRVPDFVQLDVRASKRFDIRRSRLEIYLEILNVWNRKNAEEIVYAPDYSARGVITSFPILPVLGVSWEF
ncbi:MAG: TonB-dependent receptor [Nannocystaceae bacterium]